MVRLSTGDDSTLESYIKLSTAVFGEDSPATKFLVKKAEDSPHGVKEEVIQAESQMIFLLMSLNGGKQNDY